MEKSENNSINTGQPDITDDDIYQAMKDIPGYLDITPGDFKEIYRLAWRHSMERIARSVTAAEIMTRPVFSVKRAAPLQELADLMAEKRISGVPVLEDDGTVAGIVSEKDFLSQMGARDKQTVMSLVSGCIKNKGCVVVTIRKQKAEDIMTTPAVTVSEQTPIGEIARLFSEKQINRVPVIDKEHRLAGIVSRADIVRGMPPARMIPCEE